MCVCTPAPPGANPPARPRSTRHGGAQVAAEMAPYVHTHFGNPSSGHAYGRPCREAVARARERVARMVNAQPEEIFFTSCGTESDNW